MSHYDDYALPSNRHYQQQQQQQQQQPHMMRSSSDFSPTSKSKSLLHAQQHNHLSKQSQSNGHEHEYEREQDGQSSSWLDGRKGEDRYVDFVDDSCMHQFTTAEGDARQGLCLPNRNMCKNADRDVRTMNKKVLKKPIVSLPQGGDYVNSEHRDDDVHLRDSLDVKPTSRDLGPPSTNASTIVKYPEMHAFVDESDDVSCMTEDWKDDNRTAASGRCVPKF